MQFYATLFDFLYVPEIPGPQPGNDEKSWQRDLLALTSACDTFDPWDTQICQPYTLKGIVGRNHDAFSVAGFLHSVFKYVRKNHVEATIHWKHHWQWARMAHKFVYGEQS